MRNWEDGLSLSLKISKTQISQRIADWKQLKSISKLRVDNQLSTINTNSKKTNQISIAKFATPKNGIS